MVFGERTEQQREEGTGDIGLREAPSYLHGQPGLIRAWAVCVEVQMNAEEKKREVSFPCGT